MPLTKEQKRKLIYNLICPRCKQISRFYTNEFNIISLSFAFERYCNNCKGWFKVSFSFKNKQEFDQFLSNAFPLIQKENSFPTTPIF